MKKMSLVLVRPVLLLLVVLSTGAAAFAAAPPRVWLVSTRDAAGNGKLHDATECIRYWRMKEDRQWLTATVGDFNADGADAASTVVFVHGNHTDADESADKGWETYQTIDSDAGGRPFRFVIWSWPSTRLYRSHRTDAQVKAAYSDVEGYYLAAWLAGLRPRTKTCLVGHSFGVRVIAGALQLLAGGEVAGRTLPPPAVADWAAAGRQGKPTRAMFLAAAIDADSLAADGPYDRALALLNSTLVTCNCHDRVLRWYPRLYGRGGPEALGRFGPCGVDSAKNVAVIDVHGSVNKRHDHRFYCSASILQGQWTHYAFLDDPVASCQKQRPATAVAGK
jgi:esterase/lipase superfamily enzyme